MATNMADKASTIFRRAIALVIADCEEARSRTAQVKGMTKDVTMHIKFKNGCPVSVKVGDETFNDMKEFLS